MPELPEVETTVVELRDRLVGRQVIDVGVHWPGSVAEPGIDEFIERLRGRRLSGFGRRAKYIILELDNAERLIIHLRMSGQLLIDPTDHPVEKHQRLTLYLDDDRQVRFVDQRKFGRVSLVSASDFAAGRPFPALGPEPLAASFTFDEFAGLLRQRRGTLKPLLLDQSFVAGIGNIYADEALFVAGLSPLRRAEDLSEAEARALHTAIRATLEAGIVSKGTSFQQYRTTWGLEGLNQNNLCVFRRTDQPCATCGTAIAMIRLGGRATHYCPSCQR